MFRDVPEEHQEAAIRTIEGLSTGTHVRAALEHTRAGVEKSLATQRAKGKTPGHKTLAQHEQVSRALEIARDLPATGMDASVRAVHEAAMSPVREAQSAATPDFLPPVYAGEFYGEHHAINERIGQRVFGSDEEAKLRHGLASAGLSARTAPQIEVNTSVGLGEVLKHGHEIGIHLPRAAAEYLSSELKGSGKTPPIRSGKQSLGPLLESNPQAASALLQYGARAAELIPPPRASTGKDTESFLRRREAMRGVKVSIPDALQGSVGALVSGLGVTGFPKAGRAFERYYRDPSSVVSDKTHKIPSYTWNIHNANQVIAEGTHHFLGVLAHGTKWLQAHPQAHDAITAAARHPAWHDPTSTIDVWSGRVASGLPHEVSMSMGEFTNPETVMKSAGLRDIKRPKGGLGNTQDLGYLYGEEAHRRAAEGMHIRLPGFGRVHAPAHVVQSLAWYGIQGRAQSAAISAGTKTMVPTSLSDPKGLNPLRMPTRGFVK